jgi:hypothetical protein
VNVSCNVGEGGCDVFSQGWLTSGLIFVLSVALCFVGVDSLWLGVFQGIGSREVWNVLDCDAL